MDRRYLPALVIVVLFVAFGVSHAAGSIHISISPINTSLEINQNLYVEVSYSSPSNSTYELFLNDTQISSGSFSADQNITRMVVYNVTDLPYCSYKICASFSILTEQLCSSSEVYISPHPNIEFKTESMQPVFNG